jgi:uncharacterized protein YecA (UPF0149 family)
VLRTQGKNDKAMAKYTESLKISEEIGDKEGMAVTYHNIGVSYLNLKKWDPALHNLFSSISLQLRMEMADQKTADYIFEIRNKLGLSKFQKISQEVFNGLPEEYKEHVPLNEFIKDETIRHESPKFGRNDPCPCGSGKKYKKCCGK